MNLDFLDNIWKPVGKGLSEVDRFVDREMPFDSGWGAPAAVVAAIAAPEILPMMGEAGSSAGAGEGMLSSLGGSGGTFGGDAFSLAGSSGGFMGGAGNLMTSDPTSFGEGWSASGYGGGYTPQDQLGLDNLISQQSAKYPMDGASGKPSFQQLLGKQLMSGNLGSSMGQKGSYQHQDQPVQRQAAFAPTPATFQVQDKPNDIAALIAALRNKELG